MESILSNMPILHPTGTQAGPAQAAGHGDGMDRWQHSSHLHCAVVRCTTQKLDQASQSSRHVMTVLYAHGSSTWPFERSAHVTSDFQCEWATVTIEEVRQFVSYRW